MAPESFGRVAPVERKIPAAMAPPQAPNQPPPSTLAAQLVENFSASVRSSRAADETAELQKFLPVIERIKNDPELLKTAQDRIEHNHMLIYVFGLISLDGLKWGDPFVSRAQIEQLEGETLKAVNFLKMTIRETPAVLAYVAEEGTFLFRKSEPLWLWILPRVLRLLGMEMASALARPIEELCRFILLTANQHCDLWGHTAGILRYLQGCVDSILGHLFESPLLSVKSPFSSKLPTKDFLPDASFQDCTYKVATVKHALGNAWSVLRTICGAVASTGQPELALASPFQQTIPWLIDSLQSYYGVHESYAIGLDVQSVAVIQCLVDLIASQYTPSHAANSDLYYKALSVLVLLCGRLLEPASEVFATDDNGIAARKVFSFALVYISHAAVRYKPISRLAVSQILNPLGALSSQINELGPGTDIMHCISLLNNATSSTDLESFHAGVQLDSFVEPTLRQCVAKLKLYEQPAGASQPSAKRRKLSAEPRFLPHLLDSICRIFNADELRDYTLLESLISNGFSSLDEHQACQVLELLASISCATDNTLTTTSSPSNTQNIHCKFCSFYDRGRKTPLCLDISAKSMVAKVFGRIVKLPSLTNSKKSRVVAMMALRKVASHTRDPDLLDLEKSVTGHWCLQSLNSSVRELRIAAGRTLAVFLQDSETATPGTRDLVARNKSLALGLLKSLSDKNVAHLNETCIMAWGQVGVIVSDEGLSLVLVKLLDFLGHSNTMVSAFAFNEILNLVAARKTTPRRLFDPFWRSIAFSTVKDMISRPQTTRLTAELLQISVTDHLLSIQQYALPWLVLTKKKEIVQKIAEARGEKAAWQPILDCNNLGYILALLLVQDVPDTHEFVLSSLRQISSHFNNTELAALIAADPVITVLEILRDSGEGNEEKKTRARSALLLMAELTFDDHLKREYKKKRAMVARYLQIHALGLTATIAETLKESSSTHYPVHERKRSLRAMEEMIKLCRFFIRIARPQITAVLLTALAFDELRSAAMSCWAVLLTNLEDDDVDALLETTFFIIGQYWQLFDEITKTVCQEILDSLLANNQDMLKAKIYELPSFAQLSDLADVEARLNSLRTPLNPREAFLIFAKRIGNENPGVVLQALKELSPYLRTNQSYLQTSAISEKPDNSVTTLMRALLDCSARYNGVHLEISRLCVQCLGNVGCLDSNRLETVRESRQFVVARNFEDAGETTDFVLFVLEEILVKAFLSATDTSFQGYLSYVMQELLERTDFKTAYALRGGEGEHIYQKWLTLPESVREVLQPFMSSRYRVNAIANGNIEYPLFRPNKPYANWLRTFVFDLLHKGQNPFAQILFEPLRRVIKVKDPIVSEFLLPYLVVHIVVGDDTVQRDRKNVLGELKGILQLELPDNASYAERDNMKQYCEAAFRVLDYSMRWLQARKAQTKHEDSHSREAIRRVEQLINSIPADLLARRAMECGQYARALFHLEPHAAKMRDNAKADPDETTRLMSELQFIYTQIDEPDGLEGISASLGVVDLNQQILSHRKAGRWSQAQSWYEIQLAEEPGNVDAQLDLLNCLKESGQYDVLLNYVEGIKTTPTTINRIAPFAVEASWATGRWETVQKYLASYNAGDTTEVFNLGIGQALICLREGRRDQFHGYIQLLRDRVGWSLSWSTTSSLQASHDAMLKAHVLADLELIAEKHGVADGDTVNQQDVLTTLNRRLEVIGAYVNDKQYVLGIRRAAMELMRPGFGDGDISSLWLTSARLARKAGSMHQSFNAVLHAHRLGDGLATIDNARLLWKEGNHRKAIQVLQSAIKGNNFVGPGLGSVPPTSSKNPESEKKLQTAQAHLLLAKWQESAGQTHTSALRQQFQTAAKTHSQWEKGHYYLGRHYKKVLESEEALKPDDQSDEYLSGETAKLVIENYIRSLNYGTKYLYQTLPRILTLWLELGARVDKAPEGKVSLSRELYQRRKQQLEELHKYLTKHMQKMPAYIFYTALPQIVARIAHPHPAVFQLLQSIIVKVIDAHPRQSLWSLLGVMTSRIPSERRNRAIQIISVLMKFGNGRRVEGASFDLKQLMRMGEKLAEQLLTACNNGDFQSNRTTVASLSRDLGFNSKCTPCPLVVPIEKTLTATLPALTDNVRKHKAFSQDLITLDSFLDEVLVLSSLAKPRKLQARGSDGNIYGVLVKPKDDLRTDQRLMEFNGMINRSLKRDAESSRRRLYIRTYAVTPLNEECGIIEWVDGLKTLRDILLNIYKAKGISPNYGQIQTLMRDAAAGDGKNIKVFTDQVLAMFPAVLPSWFVSQFPEPSAWFAARLKYTRSCAVMSMVGTILGLGDRHGENVLLEEGNGGVFHVDFNCLFDKGLTFATPERVPFRLTHNMRAAMGIYGHEGPFRKCSELTLSILRQQEETLMTILEAFIYDPTLDLQRDKKRDRVGGHGTVRLNPHSVVESIRRKVKGLLPEESIPLGVEGQVEELIKQAIDPRNLTAMYIGWCPFL
ncbi:hypothetical protein MCOR14_004531 [Pyricularia oryzae]|nr:hypothetical protein MCOR12_004425 [Pyricularia oryzae]KAI6638081.1 hypothetical protein MCOR14_004531 [Pyricularia oryzae]